MTWRIPKPPGGPRVLLMEIFPSVSYGKIHPTESFQCHYLLVFLRVIKCIKMWYNHCSFGESALSLYSGPQAEQHNFFFYHSSISQVLAYNISSEKSVSLIESPLFMMCCFRFEGSFFVSCVLHLLIFIYIIFGKSKFL